MVEISGLVQIPPDWSESYFSGRYQSLKTQSDVTSYFTDYNTYQADIQHNKLVTEQYNAQKIISSENSALEQKLSFLNLAQANYEAESSLQNPNNYTELKSRFFSAVSAIPGVTPTTLGVGASGIVLMIFSYFILKGK